MSKTQLTSQNLEKEAKVSRNQQQESRAVALRVNLYRRKAQARNRQENNTSGASVDASVSFPHGGEDHVCNA
ncbi:MAG: hypothetical protein IJ934_04575 [Acetobacter sp.]|nr:hypothetical protein [Acetobacter sp.]